MLRGVKVDKGVKVEVDKDCNDIDTSIAQQPNLRFWTSVFISCTQHE